MMQTAQSAHREHKTEHLDETMNVLHTFINGEEIFAKNVQPQQTLLEFLRGRGLTGTKLGCGEGGCGACTVMVSHWDEAASAPKHRAVNACLAPVCSIADAAVTTVEGIGSKRTGLHPVQQKLSDSHGSQCGFCTPGIVMSMYALLQNDSKPSMTQIEHALDGNLCRCTGYRPILQAFSAFSADGGASEGSPAETEVQEAIAKTCDAQFPDALKKVVPGNSSICGDRVTWHRPASLASLLQIKAAHPECKIVTGNSEIAIEALFRNAQYGVLVSPSLVPELHTVRPLQKNELEGLEIGVATTLTDMMKVCKEAMAT
jgi:xanthine dehydrogenase/oxidase